VSIGLFSTNANRGCTSPMIRAISVHIPLRSPSRPSPFPAMETSWHGKPPAMQSTIPRHGLPSNVVTSSKIGNQGSTPSFCLADRTCWQYGSISTAQTGICPSSMSESIPPPAPAKRWRVRRRCNSVAPSVALSSTGVLVVVWTILPGVFGLWKTFQVADHVIRPALIDVMDIPPLRYPPPFLCPHVSVH